MKIEKQKTDDQNDEDLRPLPSNWKKLVSTVVEELPDLKQKIYNCTNIDEQRHIFALIIKGLGFQLPPDFEKTGENDENARELTGAVLYLPTTEVAGNSEFSAISVPPAPSHPHVIAAPPVASPTSSSLLNGQNFYHDGEAAAMPPVMIPFEWMHVLATMGAAAAAQQQQQTMAVPATAVYNQLSPTPQASSPNFIKPIFHLNAPDGFNMMLYKTAMCRHWMANNNCTHRDRCNYAHGAEELRPKPCTYWVNNGWCSRRQTCQYAHPIPGTDSNMGSQNQQQAISSNPNDLNHPQAASDKVMEARRRIHKILRLPLEQGQQQPTLEEGELVDDVHTGSVVMGNAEDMEVEIDRAGTTFAIPPSTRLQSSSSTVDEAEANKKKQQVNDKDKISKNSAAFGCKVSTKSDHMLLKKKSRSKCRAINFRVKPLQQFASELSARLDGNGSPGGGSCNITDYDFLVARFEQLFAQAVGNPRLAAEARALSSLAEDIANALHTAINQHQSNGSLTRPSVLVGEVNRSLMAAAPPPAQHNAGSVENNRMSALFSVQTHIVDVCERAFLLAHLENKINKKKKKSNIAKSLRGQPRSSTTARASCASSSATAERKEPELITLDD